MFSIFNGRERTLGGQTSSVHIQVSIDFRDHLHTLKGASLAVFLSIALHSNEDGWSWPSRALIARETGYNPNTISHALANLCQTRIQDHRILLRFQPQSGSGNFKTNRYLIFPSRTELAQYEHEQPTLNLYGTDLPSTAEPCTENPYTVEPCTVKPYTENLHTNQNHLEQEPSDEQETTDSPEAKPSTTTPTGDDDAYINSQTALCNTILYNMAIFEPTKSEILLLSHATSHYLEQWQYWYDENDDKISAGFIVSQIRRGATAPLTKSEIRRR